MKASLIRKVVAAVVLSCVLGTHTLPQSPEEGTRKVKTRVTPTYPELAKRMNVIGKVKIEVVITPDGKVKSTHALGGHPLLVQACVDALKEWKFAPASEETTQVVEFDFNNVR